MQSGTPFVCNDSASLEDTVNFNALMVKGGHALARRSAAHDRQHDGGRAAARRPRPGGDQRGRAAHVREVSGNLSFALQYLQQDTKRQVSLALRRQTGSQRSLFASDCRDCSRIPRGGVRRYVVVVIDIERLSLINDSFGRRTGDLLLQYVAERLKQRFPKTEEVAHFGRRHVRGDERHRHAHS